VNVIAVTRAAPSNDASHTGCRMLGYPGKLHRLSAERACSSRTPRGFTHLANREQPTSFRPNNGIPAQYALPAERGRGFVTKM